jgi:DNA repair protein RecN (Recombination protein N)
MLEELDISGLGIISQTSIAFGPGLNVLTGETGAGKSMVLNSVQLISGARGSVDLVAQGSPKCDVTATFSVSQEWIGAFGAVLEERGAELETPLVAGTNSRDSENHDKGLLIAREVSSAGRSKAFLGGRQVPVTALTQITESLIAVHGQSEQMRLRDPGEQLLLLDRSGGSSIQTLLNQYQVSRRSWRTLVKRRSELIANRSENVLRGQILAAGIAEIEALSPQQGELEALAAELSVSRSAESLREFIESSRSALAGTEDPKESVSHQLANAIKALNQASEHDPRLEIFLKKVTTIASDVIDIDAELYDYVKQLNADPAHLENLEQRFASLKGIIKKYGVDIDAVLAWAESARTELSHVQVSDEYLENLESEVDEALDQMKQASAELSEARRAAAMELGPKIQSELIQLAMPQAVIEISVISDPEPQHWTKMGADNVVFRIAVHKGADFRPMGKSVSGGELSRLMLAIEVVLAGEHPVPTMIFDEVDAGIGGEVAVEVGRRLAELAGHTQVIVVTHLPQVAAFAEKHFVVNKNEGESGASTAVTEVTGEARTREITRMLSGLPDSVSGAVHAAELLALAQK